MRAAAPTWFFELEVTETLLSIDAVTSDKNLQGFCRLHDNVESHVHSLRALAMWVERDSYGTVLAHALQNKLPLEVCLIIRRRTDSSEPSIGQLLKYMVGGQRAYCL